MGVLDSALGWIERAAGGVVQGVRTLRGGTPQKRKGIGERVLTTGMYGGAAWGWPGSWSQDRLEQVMHFRHWTYIAIRSICNAVAGLEPQIAEVYHPQRGNTSPHAKAAGLWYHQKSLQSVRSNEVVVPVADSHPLVQLFRTPNAQDTAHDLWYEMMMYLELTGNGYLWGIPNAVGLPVELWVVPSHWVWPRLTEKGIEHYEIRPFTGPGTWYIPTHEIIHIRYKSPLHKIDGYSPQQAGSEWIDAAESVDRSRFYQFKNGAFPMGSVELGENYHDPDDQELERIYAKFFARLQGETNYGRPMILPPGAKYTPLTISPTEMAYTQSADQLRDWTLALFGVPKEVAGIQDAGSEIAMYGPLVQFMQFCISPKLRMLSQSLTRHLARKYSDHLRIWWDDPTPSSPQQTNSDLGLDGQLGIRTPNEMRAIRGLPPYTPEEEEKYAKIGGGKQPDAGGPGGGQGGGLDLGSLLGGSGGADSAPVQKAYTNGRH